MTTPPQPGERPRRRPDPARHVSAMWMLILRSFRDHLHTNREDPDGRTE